MTLLDDASFQAETYFQEELESQHFCIFSLGTPPISYILIIIISFPILFEILIIGDKILSLQGADELDTDMLTLGNTGGVLETIWGILIEIFIKERVAL